VEFNLTHHFFLPPSCPPCLPPFSPFFFPASHAPIQILTKDSVTARVDAVVYFRIRDPIDSVVKVENAYNSTYRVAQTSLRDVLGTKNLSELLSDRETISEQMGVGLFVCLFFVVTFAINPCASSDCCCNMFPNLN